MTLETSRIVLGSESFRFGGNRLRTRTVPLFPLKHCGRPKSADVHIKPKIPTYNQCSRPGSSTVRLTIPKYKKIDYKKTAKTKIDTRSNLIYSSSQTSRPRSLQPTGTVMDYSNVKPKVDTEDPAPWIHTMPTKPLEELMELDGFLLNSRFAGIVESKSFDSVQDILEILEHESDGPVVKLHRKRMTIED